MPLDVNGVRLGVRAGVEADGLEIGLGRSIQEERVVLPTALRSGFGPLDQPKIVESGRSIAGLGRIQKDEDVDVLGVVRRFETSTDPFPPIVGRREVDPLAREGATGGVVVPGDQQFEPVGPAVGVQPGGGEGVTLDGEAVTRGEQRPCFVAP